MNSLPQTVTLAAADGPWGGCKLFEGATFTNIIGRKVDLCQNSQKLPVANCRFAVRAIAIVKRSGAIRLRVDCGQS